MAEMQDFFAAENAKAKAAGAVSATRGDILLSAHKTINGKRQDVYGKPENNFEIIGLIWQIIDQYKPDSLSNAANVALKMMGMKFARLISNPYDLDSHRDLCGYDGILSDMVQAKDKDKD
jgi:hypothetical protein